MVIAVFAQGWDLPCPMYIRNGIAQFALGTFAGRNHRT